jgi:probable HAF family extracellular repeat protein
METTISRFKATIRRGISTKPRTLLRRRRVPWKSAVCVSVCLALVGVAPTDAPAFPKPHPPSQDTTLTLHYRLTALDSPNDPIGPGNATDINDHGQIVGNGGHWKRRPFPALPGLDQRRDFGTFSIPERHHIPKPNVRQEVIAVAVNGRGQVVGYVHNFSDGAWIFTQDFPFLWQRGQFQVLAPLTGDNTSAPSAINGRGQVVGVSYDETPAVGQEVLHAVLWSDSKPLLLGQGSASAINDAGDVAGSASTNQTDMVDGSVSHATMWRGGQTINLGTLGGRTSYSEGINAKDEVVGQADTATESSPYRWVAHGFVWRAGRMTDLTPGLAGASDAHSINSRGQIVGEAEIEGKQRGVIWEDGRMTDLSSILVGAAGWALTNAYKINAWGQVLGEGQCLGKTYSVLLTPITGGTSVRR